MSKRTRAGSGGLEPGARRPVAGQQVLVVEADEHLATALRAGLGTSGYDLVHVDPDGVDDLIDALEEHRPELVLLDLGVSRAEGGEAHRRIRRDHRWALVPIVVVSADLYETSGRGGLDTYVGRPSDTDELADLVQERIGYAAELASSGVDEDLGAMSEEYLRARLIDEIRAAREYGAPFTFGLVKLCSLQQTKTTSDPDVTDSFVRSLVADARDQLPDGAVIGLTADDEVTVILPGTPVTDGAPRIERMIDGLVGARETVSGGRFEVELVAGVAGFPDNAENADELYMAADGALADALGTGSRFSRAY